MHLAGSQFTFKYGASFYSAQILEGSYDETGTISRRKTLGGASYKRVDGACTVTGTFLYDEEAGFFGALKAALASGDGVAVEIASPDAKLTGTLYADGAGIKFPAEGDVESSFSLLGEPMTLADVA